MHESRAEVRAISSSLVFQSALISGLLFPAVFLLCTSRSGLATPKHPALIQDLRLHHRDTIPKPYCQQSFAGSFVPIHSHHVYGILRLPWGSNQHANDAILAFMGEPQGQPRRALSEPSLLRSSCFFLASAMAFRSSVWLLVWL